MWHRRLRSDKSAVDSELNGGTSLMDDTESSVRRKCNLFGNTGGEPYWRFRVNEQICSLGHNNNYIISG